MSIKINVQTKANLRLKLADLEAENIRLKEQIKELLGDIKVEQALTDIVSGVSKKEVKPLTPKGSRRGSSSKTTSTTSAALQRPERPTALVGPSPDIFKTEPPEN